MNNDSKQLLTLGVSALGVLLATIVAGTSDAAGTITVTFMVGLTIIWLLNHQGAFTVVNNLFGSTS